MRLDRVYIDGFKNLKDVEARFSPDCLTTVIIGQNGTGKSNLIEAITAIFRAVDLNERNLHFIYEVEYRIRARTVVLSNRSGRATISVDGDALTRSVFDGNRSAYFPELIFGYYSGSGRRLEKLFDSHQARYYSVINKDRPDIEYEAAQQARRMFYCRPVHGVFALLAHFARQGETEGVDKLLREKLGITGFHSALAHFKEPSWFNHANWKKAQSAEGLALGRGRRSYTELAIQARDVWGARGPAGACARALLDTAFHPLALTGVVVDDYRDKSRTEAQLACFLRDAAALKQFAAKYATDQDVFAALEAADISDLFREMIVWVTRTNDASGDVSFSDLSDGERQLLMVLGLIRVSRGKEALFLLDEPDTHLNPAWQLNYLDLIADWTGVAADREKCQIILTSHNPLTIAALEAKQVRIMAVSDGDVVTVEAPFVDPRGLGFSGVLTDIFGLSSSLDRPTQELIDKRNELARSEELSPAMAREFEKINAELRHLGFLYEERDQLYSQFLRQLDNVELADAPPLTPDQMRQREEESLEIVQEILRKK